MIKFRTELQLQNPSQLFRYTSGGYFLGSCFSERMGECQRRSGFHSFSNPFGTIYNPYSLRLNLETIVQSEGDSSFDILRQDDRFYWWQAHHLLSENSESKLTERILSVAKEHKSYLEKCNYICITPGTAFVYRLKDSGQIVGNCHKVPGSNFIKELLTVAECVTELRKCINLVRHINPTIQIIFTVSPVRHLRDGFTGNSRSKARLIDAVMELEADFVHYFPAYELLLDDLRDYRFYTEDMIHPNDIAVKYIYEKFFDQFFDDTAHDYRKHFINVEKLLNHKPFSDSDVSYKTLMDTFSERLRGLNAKFPGSNAESLLNSMPI